jgi:hypothetical protein
VHHILAVLEEPERVAVVREHVLGINHIEGAPRFVILVEISKGHAMVLGTHRVQVLGRIDSPRGGAEFLESVELGPIIASDIQDPSSRARASVPREPIEIFAIGLAGAAHVQIVLEHEVWIYEIIELKMEALVTQNHGERVHGLLLRLLRETIRERLGS